MKIHFYKYQGTGNDFILIDNRNNEYPLTAPQIKHLCDRRFGIGADGLMLLENTAGYDFKMVYYNADGNESSMCGNGGRCITAFAQRLNAIKNEAYFLAIDGTHEASIDHNGMVRLKMTDVKKTEHHNDFSILNTGSPHYVLWVNDVNQRDVFKEGRTIRSQEEFQPKGINVNFAQKEKDKIIVRTYERGVEDETLSCGTGVTAVAIASVKEQSGSFAVKIETPGGNLHVTFEKDETGAAHNICLSGPADFVFEGWIEL